MVVPWFSHGFPIKTSIFPWFSYGIKLGFVHGQKPLDVENRKRGKALEPMEQWWDFMGKPWENHRKTIGKWRFTLW